MQKIDDISLLSKPLSLPVSIVFNCDAQERQHIGNVVVASLGRERSIILLLICWRAPPARNPTQIGQYRMLV